MVQVYLNTAPTNQQQRRTYRLLLVGLLVVLLAGCSPKRLVVNMVGNALAGGGGVYASDDDLDLVREAVPFGLKTYESLLAASPEHRRLLLAAASGFTQYAYAFVQDEADRLDATDLARARALRARAHKLYLRGRDYALSGLEAAHPGFTGRLSQDRAAVLAMTTRDNVPFLYWAGAAWAAALTAAKGDLTLIAELPTAAALVRRVLELDESYDGGAAHEFFIAYEGSRPEAMGGSTRRARQHYQRALELSGGQRASVYLALAEAVTLREQNLAEFRSLLAAALAVDPDRVPALRLANTFARRRAHWLRLRIPDLFLEAEPVQEQTS
jgi:predicted anti-sigma-YlaC factor YlaD